MRFAQTAAGALAALLFATSVLADDRRSRDAFSRLEPQLLFRDMVHESDVTLLFDYLRHAVAAAARGEEAPPPDELRRRADALGDQLKIRGTLAALALLKALEEDIKERLREPPPPRRPALPPSVPYTPVRH